MKHRETKTIFKDPVCKMPVSQLTAATTYEHEGKMYYFCSEGCRDEFKRTPKKYTDQWPRERNTSD